MLSGIGPFELTSMHVIGSTRPIILDHSATCIWDYNLLLNAYMGSLPLSTWVSPIIENATHV